MRRIDVLLSSVIALMVPGQLLAGPSCNIYSSFSNLTFTSSDGSIPPSQTEQISSSGANLGCPLSGMKVALSTSAPWLSVSTSTVNAPLGSYGSPFSVSVNAVGLAPGTYHAPIQFSSGTRGVEAEAAGGGITVTLIVKPGPTSAKIGEPILPPTLSPTSLSFSYSISPPPFNIPPNQTVTLTSVFAFTYTTSSNSSWLLVSPGSLKPATSASISVGVNPVGLSAGTYSGEVNVAPGGVVSVTLTVYAGAPPNIHVTPAVSGSTTTTLPLTLMQQVVVTNSGGSGTFTACIVGACGVSAGPPPAFSITPGSGTIPAGGSVTLTVNFITNGLPPGVYQATYVITAAPSSSASPEESAQRPRDGMMASGIATETVYGTLVVPTAPLSFNLANSLNGQTLSVSEAGGFHIPISAAYSGDRRPSVFVNVLPSMTPALLLVSAGLGTLPAGSTSTGGDVSVMCSPCSNSPVNIPVSFTVPSSTPTTATVLPASLSFNYQTGGNTPPPQSLTVTINPPANFSVQAGASWISASQSGPTSVSVSIIPALLPTGSQASSSVSISCVSPAICSTSIPVSVSISAVPQTTLTVLPASLSFNYQTGGNAPGPQPLMVTTNPSASFTVQSGASWLSASQSGPTGVSVSIIPALLPSGSPQSTVTISCVGPAICNTSIPVTVFISAAPPTDAFRLDPQSITFGPSGNSPALRARRSASTYSQLITLTNNTSNTLGVVVTPNSQGGWLGANISPGQVPGGGVASITVMADPTGLGAGSYSGSVLVSGGGTSKSISVTLTVATSEQPVISLGGIVVASSFGGLGTVGPGTYVEIYGHNLSTITEGWGQFFVNNVAPTTVQGVGVKINGEAAFVDYVSPGQINALLPADVSAGPAQVTVSNSLGISAPFPVTVAAQQPTLLAPAALLISGKQYAGALLPPDYATTFALPTGAIAGVTSRPAKPGEVLVLYGIGFGAVTPDVPVGRIASNQGTDLKLPLQILFGQTLGRVSYAGLATGFVGLYQINVQVPQIADNSAVPLTFTLGGTPGTQTLYTAVHQ